MTTSATKKRGQYLKFIHNGSDWVLIFGHPLVRYSSTSDLHGLPDTPVFCDHKSHDSCAVGWCKETNQLVDATLQSRPFNCRHFVVSK